MEFINTPYRDSIAVAKREKQRYATTPPFPNISFPNFFNPEMLEEVLAEFPDLSTGNGYKIDECGHDKIALLNVFLVIDHELNQFLQRIINSCQCIGNIIPVDLGGK